MANTLIWTTLPAGIRWKKLANGSQEARLRVGLLVSPRLDLATVTAVDQSARARPGEEIIVVAGKKVVRKQIFSDFIEIRR